MQEKMVERPSIRDLLSMEFWLSHQMLPSLFLPGAECIMAFCSH